MFFYSYLKKQNYILNKVFRNVLPPLIKKKTPKKYKIKIIKTTKYSTTITVCLNIFLQTHTHLHIST